MKKILLLFCLSAIISCSDNEIQNELENVSNQENITLLKKGKAGIDDNTWGTINAIEEGKEKKEVKILVTYKEYNEMNNGKQLNLVKHPTKPIYYNGDRASGDHYPYLFGHDDFDPIDFDPIDNDSDNPSDFDPRCSEPSVLSLEITNYYNGNAQVAYNNARQHMQSQTDLDCIPRVRTYCLYGTLLPTIYTYPNSNCTPVFNPIGDGDLY